jgi:hypothetical protein
MARTLTPISEKRITEYQKKISNAYKLNNKVELKKLKRLFLDYIERRGKILEDFENNEIYKYFFVVKKEKQIEKLEREIKELVIKVSNSNYKLFLRDRTRISYYQMPKETQEALKELFNDMISNDIFFEEPMIYDEKKHNEYLGKVKILKTHFHCLDEGAVYPMDRNMLTAVMELLEKKLAEVDEGIRVTRQYDNYYLRMERDIKVKQNMLDYLKNKKYDMRKYRLRQYIIKRYNEEINDGNDYTYMFHQYYNNREIFNKEEIGFLEKKIKKYTAEYKERRNVKTDKQKKNDPQGS